MSYTKEAVADSTTAIQSSNIPLMKEDRLVEVQQNIRPKIQNGQIANSKDSGSEEPRATEETVTLSPQMAALARKEQRVRQQEQAIKQRELSLAAEKAEIAELKAMKAKLAAKDYSGVEGMVDYESYTNYLIEKSGNLSPEQQALKKLEAEVEGMKQSQKNDVDKRFEAAVNERRKAVNSLIDTNPEFSKLKRLGEKGQEAVITHILETWKEDEIDLDPIKAAKEVQQLILEQAKISAALLEEESTEEQVAGNKALPPLKPGMKTLTNNMAATGEIKRPVKSFQHMSDSERYAEARRRAEEKLSQKG